MRLSIASAALCALAPVVTSAQAVTTSPVVGALAIKSIPASKIVATSGTTITTAASYMGIQCTGQCVVAKSSSGAKSGVSVKFGDASVKVEEVRTAVAVSHETPHALGLTISGSEILGIQCNAHAGLKASPNFRILGASNTGFKWAIFQGSKMVKSGHSNGEAAELPADDHVAGPMQLAVFSDGTLEITHGGLRLVMSSDDGKTIEAKSGGYLRFEDLGLYVAGVSEFGVTSAQIQGTNK